MNMLPRYIALLMAGCVTLTACENTIEPFDQDGDTSYAIYGILDMRLDRQFVRIEALRPTVLSQTQDMEGVRVFSTDLDGGQLIFWTDSLVTLDDGSGAHLYYADFRPLEGHRYVLQVGRSDETGASATTKVPERPFFYLDPTRGDTLDLKQKVYLVDIQEQPQQLTVQYTVVDVDSEVPQTIDIFYGEAGSSSLVGWEFDVRLATDRFIVMRILNRSIEDKNVRLRNLGFSLTIESEEWTRVLDPVNLARAYGFFGSVGYYEFFWHLDSQSIVTIGYVDDQALN